MNVVGDFLEEAFWTVLFGWTGWVPMEVWIGGAALLVLIVLRFLGWPGVAAFAAGVGYLLGLRRGRGGGKAAPGDNASSGPKSAPSQPSPPAQGRRTIFDIFKGQRE